MTIPPPIPWYEDPLERDRYLDGEGTPGERTARAADLARRPDVARRLEARAGFLRALAGAAVAAAADAAFEARIRAALEAQGPGSLERSHPVPRRGLLRLLRPALGAAAALLVGLGVFVALGRQRQAEAVHPVDLAARLLTWQPRGLKGAEGCVGVEAHTFALVQQGELEVRGCAPAPEGSPPGATVAVLMRPEDLPIVGYVAVPAAGTIRGGEIGVTELEDGRIVVFDMLDHGRRVYLAVDADTLRLRSGGETDAWMCAACHGPHRRMPDTPHPIVVRRAP